MAIVGHDLNDVDVVAVVIHRIFEVKGVAYANCNLPGGPTNGQYSGVRTLKRVGNGVSIGVVGGIRIAQRLACRWTFGHVKSVRTAAVEIGSLIGVYSGIRARVLGPLAVAVGIIRPYLNFIAFSPSQSGDGGLRHRGFVADHDEFFRACDAILDVVAGDGRAGVGRSRPDH